MIERAASEARQRALIRPVTVIVPVFNASDEVRRLIASLETSVSSPEQNLSFVFADDGSSDPEMRSVWALPFFSRADVRLRRSETNVGFIRTVNAVFADLRTDSDIVILNSDTRVCGSPFATLQEDAWSTPMVASVTPLTTNGTIASLFAFPGGDDLPWVSSRRPSQTS
jgi:hypothetical protein